MLRNHLDLIGRNEPVQRKAKFWQSYVRALKGTDDMRAPEQYRRPHGIFRPLITSEFPELTWPHSKSIYDDPIHPHDRINTPGYRYNPVSRETYGYSPRNLYPHHYSSPDRYRPGDFYFGELEPEDKDLDSFSKEHPHYYRPIYSIAKPIYPSYRPWNYTPRPVPRPAPLYRPLPKREVAPKPAAPSEKVAFNFQGQPIYTRGGLTRRPLSELLEPNTSIPWASIVRDPWWWEYPELRPYVSPYTSPYTSPLPFYLRDSYLSPVKRQYLWTKHPIRPFAAVY
ncbi:UNVERIFIED_CONTAM: hypothetical protein PYX00_001807 [Menopon gallinae]|uniref:Myofilin n=1 Tax=Menopon gallinae TaxID=328185 RepID=A0AAW2IEV5_9NEOP